MGACACRSISIASAQASGLLWLRLLISIVSAGEGINRIEFTQAFPRNFEEKAFPSTEKSLPERESKRERKNFY